VQVRLVHAANANFAELRMLIEILGAADCAKKPPILAHESARG